MALVLNITQINTQISSVYDSIRVKAFSKGVEAGAHLFGKDIKHFHHITLINQLFEKGEFEP